MIPMNWPLAFAFASAMAAAVCVVWIMWHE